MVRIKITATVIEEIEDGVGFPKSVRIEGAGFLAPSALVDIAQEAVNTYTGVEFSPYVAIMPDWGMRSDDMNIAIVKRRV